MTSGELEPQHGPYWERRWFPGLVFGIIVLVYVLNRSPYVGFNDGLSFLYAATDNKLDLATNATSHFLYNNHLHIYPMIFMFLSDVLALTMVSVVCSFIALLLLYRTARLLTDSQGLALLPVVVLAFSFTYWQQSEIIEVYAFNNMLFMLFVHVALKDIRTQQRRHYLQLSLVLGLGLLTHIQHILSIPFFLAYLWGQNGLRPGQKLLGMVPWMGLMSLLFILPLFTHTNDWKSVFFESKFQDELLGLDLMTLVKGVAMGIGMLVYNLHLALIPIFLGWRHVWREQRQLFWWLLALGLPYLAFAMKYAVNDNHVFYLCFYIVLVLPLVYSLGTVVKKSRRLGWMLPAAMVIPVAIYATATLTAPLVPALQRYDVAKAYKGGVVHLLWPGKAWAKDPLELAKEHWYRRPNEEADHVDEWNYVTALRYLRLKG